MTPFVHALRERETINNLMEEICGARLTYNYIRIGGVGYDIVPPTLDQDRRVSRSLRADRR